MDAILAAMNADAPSGRPTKARTDLAALGVGLKVSDREVARAAGVVLERRYSFADDEAATSFVAIGGDGYLLHVLHDMLESGDVRPVFGMNRGTVGFLMNEWRVDRLKERLTGAKAIRVMPLEMAATDIAGNISTHAAINEVSLLRETRQTAKIEIAVNDRVVLPELVADGVLVATPAGSTAYNLSAHGPILPLQANMLAMTAISPFRPRRWQGAIIADDSIVRFRVLDPDQRMVSAVADQFEVRDVREVVVRLLRDKPLTLLFDPEHALDERIAMEQFIT